MALQMRLTPGWKASNLYRNRITIIGSIKVILKQSDLGERWPQIAAISTNRLVPIRAIRGQNLEQRAYYNDQQNVYVYACK
jgi:hypothetical protein